MRESAYQAKVISKLRHKFPDCVVLKNDTDYRQGLPDLLVLFEDRWAALEVKAYEDAPEQPNQDYYVRMLDRMSYASFIYPENEEEVFHDLQQTFGPRRSARVSKR
jgi:hypothetical protein